MELFKFISEILGDGVKALGVCSDGDEKKADEQMRTIALKIMARYPDWNFENPATPGQGES